jgi:hypothetical protein
MEDGPGSTNQPQDAQQPDEVPSVIQQQQRPEATRSGDNNHQPPENRIETIWGDFWRIPLKDRLMIWTTLLLLLTAVVTAWVFFRQLQVMQDTLIEIKSGGGSD